MKLLKDCFYIKSMKIVEVYLKGFFNFNFNFYINFGQAACEMDNAWPILIWLCKS